MKNSNLQVRISPEVEEEIERLAPKSRSAFVREAIEEKIRRDQDLHREAEWIKALSQNPEGTDGADDWLKAEAWGSR